MKERGEPPGVYALSYPPFGTTLDWPLDLWATANRRDAGKARREERSFFGGEIGDWPFSLSLRYLVFFTFQKQVNHY